MTSMTVQQKPVVVKKSVQKRVKQENSFGEIIKRVALKILKFIGKILTFPFRYIGSKTWSIPGLIIRTPYILFKRALGINTGRTLKEELFGTGYHYGYEKKLTKEELIPFFPYVAAAAVTWSDESEWIKPFGYQLMNPKSFKIEHERIDAKKKAFYDPKTGLKVVVMEKGNDVIVAFGAIGAHRSIIGEKTKEDKKLNLYQHTNVVTNLLGIVPDRFRLAERFFAQLKEHHSLKGKKITLAGQCYGGTVAQYLALKNRFPASCFNCLPMGAGLQYKLGNKALREADKYVKHLVIRRDFVSDTSPIPDVILSGLGLRTPGNFGKKYRIPSAYKEGDKRHNFVLGSMMHHLGYSERAKPMEVFKDGVVKLSGF